MSEYLSRPELMEIVSTVPDQAAGGGMSPEAAAYARFRDYVLVQIELEVERATLDEIHRRQARVPGLRQDETGCLAWWGGDLVPGCRDYCLKGENLSFRHSSSCNLKCDFCYYYGTEVDLPLPPQLYQIGDGCFDLDTLRVMAHRQDLASKGIGWVYLEPFCEEDKIYPAMEVFAKAGAYQYLYTNGTLLMEESVRKLADTGLNEIRFNLAASKCADTVLDVVSAACARIEHVCIESPVYHEFATQFLEKRQQILDTGVQYIHLAELQVTDNAMRDGRWEQEGPIYRHKRAYISPISSRRLIYDIFDAAAAEGWDGVTIHDCSNDVKLYRGVRPDGGYEYQGSASLPEWFFVDAVQRYDLEDRIRRSQDGAVSYRATDGPAFQSRGRLKM